MRHPLPIQRLLVQFEVALKGQNTNRKLAQLDLT